MNKAEVIRKLKELSEGYRVKSIEASLAFEAAAILVEQLYECVCNNTEYNKDKSF